MNKKKTLIKKAAFSLLILLIICLAVTTFVEKYQGTEYVNKYVYGSRWFIIIWVMLSITTISWIIHKKMHKQIAAFSIHLAFLIILTGAFLTFLTGQKGHVHLRIGEEVRFYTEESSWESTPFPFTLSLDSFKIDYYPGTTAPSDYISYVKVNTGEKIFFSQISMNNILSEQGYRFYQSSFDEDLKGTILSVNVDRWGITVTYSGYILLGISMLLLLFSANTRFRKLLKHPLLKGGLSLLLIFFPTTLLANCPSSLSKEKADQLGEVVILYNSRVVPLETFARDFTMKLTGKPSYKEYSAEQVLLGWIFYPQEWQFEPLIRVKNKELQKMLKIEEYASITAFFSDKNEYLLASFWKELHKGGEKSSLLKAIEETDEKVQLITMLEQGSLLKLFPYPYGNNYQWFSPTEEIPKYVAKEDKLLIQNLFTLLYEAAIKKDNQEISQVIEKLKTYQKQKGGKIIPVEWKIKSELLYNKMNLTPLLYRINLSLGLICMMYFLFIFLKKGSISSKNFGFVILTILLSLSFIYLTIGIILRTYISGRIPLGNGYETMLFVSWCIMFIGILFSKKFKLAIAFSFLLSGFTLLVSSLGQMNPQITPLMPVLLSHWLSTHVSFIMISYALFAFIFFNSVISLLFIASQYKGIQHQRLMVVNRIFLYPAVFFLGAGIFIGAIWANVSWGRYWAWDPKEVWALITFLIYGIAFHNESISWFRKPLFFHIYMILAFGTILMTYFGVNLFLGGIHSYK